MPRAHDPALARKLREPLRLKEAKSWLDHSDIRVTQRYGQLAPDAIRGKVVTASVDEQGVTPAANQEQRWPV